MRCKMCGVFILREHTCSSVVLIVKIVMLNFEYVKYSSLLNTLKGICFDDKQYVYCTNSRGTKARSWSCHSGLGLVSFGLVVLVLVFDLGLKNLVLFTSLVITNSNASHDVVLSCCLKPIASPVSLTNKQPYHLQ